MPIPRSAKLSLIILMCALPFGLVVTNQTQAQSDPPVEQTHKNIQVLKGLRDSQLFSVMNFVATSLGVRCDHCHVKNGKNPTTGADNWIWESDDKPKKLIARQMMKMVMDINRANFDSQTSVTCYTCHRGNVIVARLPALPPHEPIRKETTATALPTAEQIFTKYIAAVGGKDAVTKFKTTVMKGTVVRSEGRQDPLEVTLKQPDKYLITWTTPQDITASGLNGETGWLKNSKGVTKLSGTAFDPLKRATEYYRVIKVAEQPAQMKVIGMETIGDRETYVLLSVVDADTTRKYFFDTQTGLLLRELTTRRTLLVPLPEQIDFEDYRDVDGIKLPFTIRVSDASPFPSTRRFTEIKHNVIVDDTVFNQPAAPR
ncbi:MAG TPA: c-type cytochrome [Pyrinomonadaceae bacterium]